jgi:hypothetical protein
MPTQLIDDFGAWDDLGTVQPFHETWTFFPDYTESSSDLIRFIFGGDIDNASSFAYIRAVYQLFNQDLYGRWFRIFPKFQQDIALYTYPRDLQFQENSPILRFQVQKRSYYRRYIGTFPDSIWTVRLLVRNEQFDPGTTEEGGNPLVLNVI